MISDRRAFKRFDIFTVVEFYPLSELPFTSIGLMKNFSCGGFSLEAQHFDFERDDCLEFKFKHPGKDLYVTSTGQVVWKDRTDKFAHLAGIQFKEMDMETRIKMLEIMSAAGDIPVDSFIIEGESEQRGVHDEGRGFEVEEADDRETAPVAWHPFIAPEYDVSERAEDLEETTDEQMETIPDIPAEDLQEVEFLAQESPAEETYNEGLHGEEAHGHVTFHRDDLLSTVYGPSGEREQHKVLKFLSPYREELQKAVSGIFGEDEQKKKVLIFGAAAVVFVFVLLSLLMMSNSPDKGDTAVRKERTDTAAAEREKSVPRLPIERGDGTGLPMQVIPPPVEDKIIEDSEIRAANERKEVRREVTSRSSAAPPVMRYVVQVGAWSHPDYAESMLKRLHKYYPDAYILPERGLDKIFVPGIASREQGNRVIKDIEEKFKLKPVLRSEASVKR